jgi:hypothetical protein
MRCLLRHSFGGLAGALGGKERLRIGVDGEIFWKVLGARLELALPTHEQQIVDFEGIRICKSIGN